MKGRLDALVSRFLDPARKLPEEATIALGLAAHEIVHLDRVPAYASVNWAVDWAKGYTRAHLDGLFNAVLRRVSGMETGAFVPRLAPVDLCDVVEGLRPELRVYVEGKRLRLAMVSECAAGPFWVLGERRLLDAVLSNLLKNAAEASPDGGEIRVTLRREDDVAVAFLRNAGEVPQAVRERFFEKYATWGKPHVFLAGRVTREEI